MLDEVKARSILDFVLARSAAEQTQVFLYVKERATTRFAKNYIHQNVYGSEARLWIKAIIGRKAGSASTCDLSERAIIDTLSMAAEMAKVQPESPLLAPLAGPSEMPAVQGAYFEKTASCNPEVRARSAGIICSKSNNKGLEASGAFSTGAFQVAIANTLGLYASHSWTLADINIVVQSDSSSGYAEQCSLNVDEMDMEALALEAVDKALRSKNPVAIEPGEYEVILEDYVVSDILSFLGYLGFSAQAVQEGRSFVGGRTGQRVLSEKITIWDDGMDSGTVPMPFDYEGVPKKKVDFIVNGVARDICYDSYTGAKDGKSSTGNASFPGDDAGPVPVNMFLKTGNSTLEEMISSTERGLLITRFHYTRPVHPLKVVVTGMTRDGTFLVEKGEIRYPVKNMRFTQSYVEALKDVQLIGREARLRDAESAYNMVPALKISRFNFTGSTDF